MRTFIAIPLPAGAKSLLETEQRKLRSCNADVRWTAVSGIHLTLRFLGEVDPGTLPQLEARIREATLGCGRFALRLQGLGAFPGMRNPRVVWYGLDGGLPELAALQARIESACAGLGFLPEDRPFHPHLTLGRVRGKTNLQPLIDYIKIGAAAEFEFEVKDYNIYQSTLRPQGATYTVLASIALAGDAHP